MILVLSLLALGLVLYYGFNVGQRFKLRRIPGPFGTFLFGNVFDAVKEGQYEYYLKYCKGYGITFKYFIGRRPVVATSDHDIIKQAGSKFLNRSLVFNHEPTEAEIESSGIFTNILVSRNSFWFDIRKITQVPFMQSNIEKYFPSMVRTIDSQIWQMKQKEGEMLHSIRLGQQITLMAFLEAAFNVKLDLRNQVEEQQIEKLEHLANDRTGRWKNLGHLFTIALIYCFPEVVKFAHYFNIPIYKCLKMTEDLRLAKYVVELMHEKSVYEERKFQNADQLPNDQKKNNALTFIKLLDENQVYGQYVKYLQNGLVNGKYLNETQILSNISTMFMAGHDTTATTIGMLLFRVAKHQDIQNKLLEEVDSYKEEIDYQTALDLDQFPYVRAVISETLRLYPPGSWLVREIPKGQSVDIGSQKLYNPVILHLDVRGMNRHEKYYKDSHKFNPDRFLKGNPEYEDRPKGLFIPFGIGSRKCLGYRFAELQLILAVLKIFQNLTFTLPQELADLDLDKKDIEFDTEVTITPRRDILVIPHTRKGVSK